MARKPGGKNNAITHGAYAKDLLLPNESSEEFEQLHQGLIEDWDPTGTTQDETVLTLAQLMWSKRRIERFYHEEAAYLQYQNPEMGMVLYLANALDDAETVAQATPYISTLPELYRQRIEETVPRSKFDDDKSWIECVKSKILVLARYREEVARATVHLTGKAHRSANLRELTAKKIALLERIDAGIDKALKRLAQLKAFKQIEAEQGTRYNEQRSIANHRPRTN